MYAYCNNQFNSATKYLYFYDLQFIYLLIQKKKLVVSGT